MRASTASGGWLAAGALAGVGGMAVLWPAAVVGGRVATGIASERAEALSAAAPDAGLLLKTVAVAALVAAVATLLGWPGAWAMRNVPARTAVVLVLPLLFPSYLVSAGWGLLRAPGTALGDWLITSHSGAVVGVGFGLALAGLCLWASPIAALLIGAQLARTDADVIEALRMVPAPRWRYWLALLGMARGGVVAALAAVFLVTLGSAVPLHVAQLDTYAIRLWRTLDESGPGEHWRVWVTAWPLIVVAIAAAWFLSARLRAESAETARGTHAAPGRVRISGAVIAAAAVWALAVVVPAVLFALSLRGVKTLHTFWLNTWKPIVSRSEEHTSELQPRALIS